MKKIKYIAVLFFCCAALLLVGCNQAADPMADLPEPSFEVGEPHSNAVAFRLWFETMSSTAGPCTVSIQDKIYDEEQAADWWYAIQSDLAAVYETLNMEEDAYTPFTIYIVENALNGIQVWNNYLYCTPDDVLSGDYRVGLLGAALTTEPWKLSGLMRSLFDAEQPDTEQITAYLEEAEDLDILSLFAAYFVEDFAMEEEIAVAQGLAQLLCEHVIAEHGGVTLVKDACLDCRQELLDELGVNRTYTDLYDGFDSGYRYSSSADYPLIAATPKGDTFYLLPLPGDMETPAEVRRLLYDAWKGPQVILEGVKADAPEYADVLAQNYSAPITVYLDPQRTEAGTGSVTYSLSRRVYLGYVESIVHEIMHIIVPLPGYRVGEDWKYEACADYFNYRYYPPYKEKQSQYDWIMWFLGLDELTDEYSEDEALYLADQKYTEVYLAHAGFPQTADDIDLLLSRRVLLAATYIFRPDYELESIAEFYHRALNSYIKAEGGNALSYFEASIFADYLVQNYSLSAFLKYCLDPNVKFKAIYDVDYETAEAAWRENLMGM